MSKPINHTLIGAFVLGAFLLLIGSIISISSCTFNKRSYPFVIYLTDSLNGLNINSDVKFKGVKVGRVKQILLNLRDYKKSDFSIPVVIEIDERSLQEPQLISDNTLVERVEKSIDEGLRARIQQANLLTGMLYIELDYFPGTPETYRGDGQTDYVEIPTVPSNMSQMLKSVAQILENISQIDFKAFSESLKETANNLNESVSAIEFDKINDNIVQASEAANKLLSNPKLASILNNAERITQSTAKLSEQVEENFGPLQADFQKTTEELRITLDQVSRTMLAVQNSIGDTRSSIGQEFSETLNQLNEAARSVRELSDYLRAHPDALLLGAPEQ